MSTRQPVLSTALDCMIRDRHVRQSAIHLAALGWGANGLADGLSGPSLNLFCSSTREPSIRSHRHEPAVCHQIAGDVAIAHPGYSPSVSSPAPRPRLGTPLASASRARSYLANEMRQLPRTGIRPIISVRTATGVAVRPVRINYRPHPGQRWVFSPRHQVLVLPYA